jgi:hypothetical protein
VSLEDSAGAKAILIAIVCNHCPFVVWLEKALVDMVSNAPSFPQALHAA